VLRLKQKMCQSEQVRAQLKAGWCNSCAVQFLSLLEPGKKTFALTTFANWTLLFWNIQSSVQPPIMGWTEPHSRHQHIRLQHTIKGTWEKIFGCNTTTTLIIYIQLLLGVWGRLLTVCTSTQTVFSCENLIGKAKCGSIWILAKCVIFSAQTQLQCTWQK